nr:1,4-alpha-glucan branching enzyme [Nitrospira sp.]
MTQQPATTIPFHTNSRLTDNDIYLFNEGSHFLLYDKLGAHLGNGDGQPGTHFAVWAPEAEQVSVVGNFNDWHEKTHPLKARGYSGIWEGFIPEATKGSLYKFHINSRHSGYSVNKSDPLSFFNEIPPKSASIVWDLDYDWTDADWMHKRR